MTAKNQLFIISIALLALACPIKALEISEYQNSEEFTSDLQQYNTLVTLAIDSSIDQKDVELYNSQFQKAIEILSQEYGSEFTQENKFAKINIDNKSIADLLSYYQLNTVPSIVIQENGKKNIFELREKSNVESIVQWLKHYLKSQVIRLQTQEDFENFLKLDDKSKVLAIYSTSMKKEINVLEQMANYQIFKEDMIYSVGLCVGDCKFEYNEKTLSGNSFNVIKHFQDYEQVSTKVSNFEDSEDLKRFVNVNSLPPIIIFDEVNITRIMNKNSQATMILFLDSKSDNEEVLKLFYESALYNRKEELFYERIYHSVFYYDDEWSEIKEFFGAYDPSHFPALFITTIEKESIRKFKYQQQKVTYEGIQELIQDFRTKNLEPFLLSEEIPDQDQNATVFKLVRKNFKENIEGPDNYVVLFCDILEKEHCQFTYLFFNYLAEKLKDEYITDKNSTYGELVTHRKLRFGYMDINKNEIKEYSVSGVPEIALWMNGQKKKIVQPYLLPHTLRLFASWLNSCLPELQVTLTEEEEQQFIDKYYKENPAFLEKYQKYSEQNQEQSKKLSEEEKKIDQQEVLYLGGGSAPTDSSTSAQKTNEENSNNKMQNNTQDKANTDL